MVCVVGSAPGSAVSPFAIHEILQQRIFFGVMALLFVVSTVVTFAWCTRMSTMAGMPMPGDWTMSMAWMRMPGQTWVDVTASFLGMWVVMMVAMMLPSLLPMLWRYRQVVVTSANVQTGWLTASVGLAYFLVWTLLGVLVFLLGIAMATLVMDVPALSQAIPMTAAVTAILAGALQLTQWKAIHLKCCRESIASGVTLAASFSTAWRHGLRLGLHCCYCCAAPTAVLLVAGVMNTWAMLAVTAAISAERLAPGGERIARISGVIMIATGVIGMGALAMGFRF